MAPFTHDELNFGRIDVQALVLVSHFGLATIDETRRDSRLTWLRDKGYQVEHLNCSGGKNSLIRALGELLKRYDPDQEAWEEGSLNVFERNALILDLLRDSFMFEVPSSGGLVLELFRSDVIWCEDATWLLGLLKIASQHSLQHLACGRRFFTLQVLPEPSPEAQERAQELQHGVDDESQLVGQTIERVRVPYFERDFPFSWWPRVST
jgi:hypothetical protein